MTARSHSTRKAEIVMSDQRGEARGTDPVTDERHAASSGRFGRRALMLGAAATGAGVAASVAGGGIAEAAAPGHPVQLGKFNASHATTEVSTNAGTGLKGQSSANGPSGVAGVAGFDTSSGGTQGVFGHSVHGQGVLGTSQHGTGITGLTSTKGKSGVAGIDQTATAGARGVFAQSPHGDALYATSPNGTALHGESANGLALFAQGKAKFAQSGVATVASGHASVTVSVPGIGASDIVLATIQTPQSGLAVAGAQASSGSMTITLTSPAGSSVHVGWLVIA
jgi:hypothetical protein